MPHATQCRNAWPGPSRSSTGSASSTVRVDGRARRGGGGTFSPSQVNPLGIEPPGPNAGLVSRTRAPPPRAAAGTVTTTDDAISTSTVRTRRTPRRLRAGAAVEPDGDEEDPGRAHQVADPPERERRSGDATPSEAHRDADDDQRRAEPGRHPRAEVPGDRGGRCRSYG